LARRWKANTLTRAAGSYQSDSSELWVGVTTARPAPAPMRAATSITTLTASPVPTENSAQVAAPTVAIRTRLRRSHQNESGTSMSSTATVVAATRDSAAASDRPKWSRMSAAGRRTPSGRARRRR
jgi:hypothetical protein